MLTGIAALKATVWSRLYHAYGRAIDTPEHLRALLREDSESREKAMEHLWHAVIHQGTAWTATGPAALVVAGLLSDERLDRGEPVRAELLSFLTHVAKAPKNAETSLEELRRMAAFDIGPLIDSGEDDALYGVDDAGMSFFARSILGCIEAAPELFKVMWENLSHDDPRVRTTAAMGTVALAKIEPLGQKAKEIEERLLHLAENAKNPDERSAFVLAMGEVGFSPFGFLDDPSPAVRMCAALAPSLASHPAAIDELLQALENHAGEIDEWFQVTPPQFHVRPRFFLVGRLVGEVKDFDRLVDAAIAVLQVTEKYCVDYDWGPLLAAAFPAGDGRIETEAQCRFLDALVKKRRLWDPSFGNASLWFQRAGLPEDRRACAKLVKKAK